MNERIRLLAEQAELEFDDDSALWHSPIYYATQKNLEKFAKLLIKEAAKIADDFQRADIQDRDVEYTILEHFEIE
jgi:histone H3/H4